MKKSINLKKKDGITLIALIITIIILVILAAISIKHIMDIDFVNIAVKSTEEYSKEQVNEEKEMKNLGNFISSVLANEKTDTPASPEDLEKLKQEYKELEEKYINYKETVIATLTKNGINASTNDSISTYTEELNKLPGKNYSDGATSEFIKLTEGSNSRYANQINCTSLNNPKRLTENNFFVITKGLTYVQNNDKEDILTMSKTYNQDTGTLYLGKQKSYGDTWTFWNIYDVYAFVDNNTAEIQPDTLTPTQVENDSYKTLMEKFRKLQENYNKLDQITKEFLNNNDEPVIEDDTIETIGQKINNIAIKNFMKGVYTKFIKVGENYDTRYAQTINVNGVEGFQNLSVDDILIVNKQMTYVNYSDNKDSLTMGKSYDPTSGVLTTSMLKSYTNKGSSVWTFSNKFDVYVLK